MKNKSERNNNNYGFTIIELMLVVAIIAILASLSIPQYLNYQCKAKQVEPRQSLGSLAKCQQAYFSEHGTYATLATSIGFSTKGNSKYEYSISDVTFYTYNATASSKEPGIARKGVADDEWIINHNLILTHQKNACID